ncbi:MAG: class I SAM-dependent methyltransferase [Bacteriovoracaceae bacterium]
MTITNEKKAQRHISKYENTNFIHRHVLNAFQNKLLTLMNKKYKNVLEIGCGEGLLLKSLLIKGFMTESYCGIDTRREAIKVAQEIHPNFSFKWTAYQDFATTKNFDLIICSQVLEHLEEPSQCLQKIAELANNETDIVLSVPWEPWFMLSNFVRGRDLLSFGNHPEHIQHWSASSFQKLARKHFSANHLALSFPFLIIKSNL